MSKKRIKLADLKVKSFVTILSRNEQEKTKGGITPQPKRQMKSFRLKEWLQYPSFLLYGKRSLVK